MYRRAPIAVLLAVSCAAAAPENKILGVAEAGKPFLVGSVETKPEAGPAPVVDGDRVRSQEVAVSFRLEGENRAVLGVNSTAGLSRYGIDGVYFYLTAGSIRFEARKQPLAICAADRLYVPSLPASGEVAIENGRAQVRMTVGTMLRPGTDACGEKAAPLLTETPGSVTATATAASAGATTSAARVGAVVIAAGATAGLASAIAVAATTPPAESPITPVQ